MDADFLDLSDPTEDTHPTVCVNTGRTHRRWPESAERTARGGLEDREQGKLGGATSLPAMQITRGFGEPPDWVRPKRTDQ